MTADKPRDRLRRYGATQSRLAWAIEIVAVSVGLALAWALAYEGWRKAGGAVPIGELFLAGGGFVIVSLAELAKIPTAIALVHLRWAWKPFVGALLLLLSLITFETVFFSLERGFTLRVHQVEAQRREVEALERQQGELVAAQGRGRDLASASAARLDAQAQAMRAGQERLIAALAAQRAHLEEQRLSPQALALRRQRDEMQARLDRLKEEEAAEKQKETQAFQSQRDSYERRIQELAAKGLSEEVRQTNAALLRLAGPARKLREIEVLHAARRAPLEQGLSDLDRKLASLAAAPSPAVEDQIAAIERQIADATARRAAAEAEIAAQARQAGRMQMDQLKEQLDGEKELMALAAGIGAARARLAELAELSQVHRVAAAWFRVRPSEIARDQAQLVATAWFGSIALLAAIAGAATAILGQALLLLAERPEEHARSSGKLVAFLRRWLLRWRFRRVRTVEIVVEVPTTEVIYVPLLTDDPAVVKEMLRQDLPSEVVDLVKARTKDAGDARAA